MNGAVFQVSAMMMANLLGHSDPVQTMCECVTELMMPAGSKLHFQSTAVTAVGIAHGMRTAARISPRRGRPYS